MGTYEISVTSCFTARHAVRAAGGGMEPPHEHEWRVTAVLRAGRLNDDGLVADFLAVRAALERIAANLSGKDLNAVVAGGGAAGASAERVAEHLAGAIGRESLGPVYCVRVTEAPGCEAAFYPGPFVVTP